MKKISVVLATRNEADNIASCLASVKDLADEVVVVDESSIDETREIAKSLGARVYKVRHEEIFHKTKQKALDLAQGEWILQLDADERVTPKLASEIREVIEMGDEEIKSRKIGGKKGVLLRRHKKIIESRDGKIGMQTGEVVAFLLPRINFFLGKPLIYGGVYPDPAIRLVKKGKAHFPAKSVHEIMSIDGEVAWLFNDLEHRDSPTLTRYLTRFNRYTTLIANEMKERKLAKNWFMLFYFTFIKPTLVFLKYYFRHKAVLDGMRGFLWSFFSASRFTISYFKYWGMDK